MADRDDDALDVLGQQDRIVSELLQAWKQETKQLEEGDSVEVRSERGANVKLLLQHVAIRESAIADVTAALQEQGQSVPADLLEGDGVARREAIGQLERDARGLQAISLNNADVSRDVLKIAEVFDQEMSTRDDLMARISGALGPTEDRQLHSARYVRTHSPTAPSPVEKWHDRIGPVKALRALYDHLRGTPRGGTTPSIDKAREGTPGLRK